MGSCQLWHILYFTLDQASPHQSCRCFRFSDSGIVLEWAVTHQSDPFPYPYSTGPSGFAILGKNLLRIRCRRRHELLLILKVLILLMEKLPLSELVLCPSWVCFKGLDLGRPVVYRCGSCVPRLVLGVFLGHQNHSLNFHLLYGWYSSTLQGRRLRRGTL